MSFKAFFNEVPGIKLHDGLAELLGASEDGMIEYGYADAVRLAGHSCPTVASAYLMALAAVKALYPDETPERGNFAVTMSAPEAEGVTGVIAQVFTLVTGAAADNGFHGIAGKHKRKGLLAYGDGSNMPHVKVSRVDTGEAVMVESDLSSIAPHPELQALAGAVLQGVADKSQEKAFGEAWQDRVKRLLLEHADDPAVIRVSRLEEAATA